jgi:peptide/nickel transport system substrate-binding protein
LKEAGVPNPSFTLMTPTTSDAQRIAQIVQAMAKDAGFDIKIQSTEFATSLDLADKGQFEAYVLAWSGRADPDGNLHTMLACKGPTNYAGYCKEDVDKLIDESRTSLDPTRRIAAYDKIAQQVAKDRPIVYLYHRHWLWAHGAKLTGLRTVPDGMVRVQDLRMQK